MTDSSKFGGFDAHDSGPGVDDDLPAPLDALWDPIKRGGVRMLKCRACGLESFEADIDVTEAHERGGCYEKLKPQVRVTSQQLIKALDRARVQADDDLLRRIGVSMASFIAEIDENSNDVAAYIAQRLAPLIPLTHVDFRVRDALESIASDGRRLGR